MKPSSTFLAIVLSFLIWVPDYTFANDVEPRLYSNVPVGVNFIGLAFARSTGEVSFDSSIPAEDVRGNIETLMLTYSRGLDIAGRSGLLTVALPYSNVSLDGTYLGQPASGERQGWNNPTIRLGVNLYGAPALQMKDFASYQQKTIVGMSLSIGMPFGRYLEDKVINTGTNRWAVTGQMGVSHRIGPWTIEGAASISWSSANDEFLGERRLEPEPLYLFRTSLQYSFRPNLWIGIGTVYIAGGETTVDGVRRDDRQNSWRTGIAFSAPLGRRHTIQARITDGVTARIGSDFRTYGLSYVYTF